MVLFFSLLEKEKKEERMHYFYVEDKQKQDWWLKYHQYEYELNHQYEYELNRFCFWSNSYNKSNKSRNKSDF